MTDHTTRGDHQSGAFESCMTNMTDVKAWLATAHQHVASARLLVRSDTVDVDLVIEACHQAVRKAIWADMNFKGIKIASGVVNKHQVTIRYGEAKIADVPPDLWRRVGALRKARNESDYANPTTHRLTSREAHDAIEIADATVGLITRAIHVADQAGSI